MLGKQTKKNKAFLKLVYKTYHGTFETSEDLAACYNIDKKVAERWIKSKITDCGWQIRYIYLRIDGNGKEISLAELFGEVEDIQ